MKHKILTSILMLASFGGFGTMIQASAATPTPQVRIRIGPQRRHYRDNRIVTQTRIVSRGRWRYRETYRVSYFPGGRTQTTLISRQRIY
jgi:hypothetical protein